MTVSTPPFRADHVGSLLRPESLREARERLLGEHGNDRNLGAHDNAELRALEDAAVRDVIALQQDIGIRAITDGEFRRRTWWTDFVLGFDGVEEDHVRDAAITFKDAVGHRRPIPAVQVTGPIKWSGSVVRDGFAFLAKNTGGASTAKLTIPAPMDLHYLMGGTPRLPEAHYPDPAAFWDDLVAAYRAEVAALYDAGCRYLQLDDVAAAFLCDPERQDEVRGWGHEPEALLRTYVDAMNAVIDARGEGMCVTMHICRGNASAHWGAAGGYGPVAETLFNEIAVDGFFLEYDSERAGDFQPLSHLPPGKRAVLGIVTSKSPELEDKDALKRRIDEAARFAPLEQLCISPQCGFASNYIGNPVTVDDQRRKLALLVEVAEEVWGNA